MMNGERSVTAIDELVHYMHFMMAHLSKPPFTKKQLANKPRKCQIQSPARNERFNFQNANKTAMHGRYEHYG
jgi:hypothetical protein